MSKKYHVKKGDLVKVIAGKDGQGSSAKTGKILAVYTKTDRVLVEGVNFKKKHVKPTQENPKGGIVTSEAPIHISNVMLIDPKTNEPTRVGRKQIEVDGKTKWVRISKKTGEII